MNNDIQVLLHHAENLFIQAKKLESLNEALKNCLNEFGMTTFSFTYYSYYPNSLNKLKYDFSSKNFDIWHKHYVAENYADIDSTLEEVHRTSLPKFWDLNTQLAQAKSEKERQMRLDSIQFGAEKGLSIPIHGPQEDFAILLLVQMRGESCLDDWRINQYFYFSLGYYYYSYLVPLLLKQQAPTEKYQLNKREMQCLLLTAKQYDVAAIAKNLCITERTVNFHLQRANKKLGKKNKHQSVAKAIQAGLIKL